MSVLSPSDLGLPLLDEEDELEPFDTFALNAMSKARYFHVRAGIPALADDSGLCVDHLGGAPGVRSRRFAPPEWKQQWGEDEANNRWLLEELAGVSGQGRGARYVCAVAVTDELNRAVFEGVSEGRIAAVPRGEGGFGYDPLFRPVGHEQTYGELPPEVKEATSHRAIAVRRSVEWIKTHVAGSAGAR